MSTLRFVVLRSYDELIRHLDLCKYLVYSVFDTVL